jgi:hypothetical protein
VQFGGDVEAVQAQVVGCPAGAEPGGEVAEAGLVHVLDEAAEPADLGLACLAGEVPPAGGGPRGVGAGRSLLVGKHLGDPGRQRGQRLLQCLEPRGPLSLLADVSAQVLDQPFEAGQFLGGFGELEDDVLQGRVGHWLSPPHGNPAASRWPLPPGRWPLPPGPVAAWGAGRVNWRAAVSDAGAGAW